MKIEFIDFQRQLSFLREEINNAFSEVLSDGYFVGGKFVRQFELQFSKELGTRNFISTGNGTDAIYAILRASGITDGDEVITPAFSWISSSETITSCHARPVFVDVDPEYYLLDPVRITEKITSKTKAIIAVHLYGQPCDMDRINSIAEKHRLLVIEDCAQAHFSTYKNRYTGTFGHAAAFSFYPTKNLGALGDAGGVATNNDEFAEKIRRLVNHGALQRHDHLFEGFNSRMDSIQAAVLLKKLPHVKAWNERRRQLAETYQSTLNSIPGLLLPQSRQGSVTSFHQYVVKTEKRDALKNFLQERGVETLIHYPGDLPGLPAYSYLQPGINSFPVAGKLKDQVLSLPIHPFLKPEEIDYISGTIKSFFQGSN